MAPLKMPKPYPTLVEERAHDTPDRAFAIIPKTAALEDGYTNLTYAQLERGMDKMSWWLDEQLGSATNFETFAYIGASDHRYTLLCLAATKTGRQVRSLPEPNTVLNSYVVLGSSSTLPEL
jgi:acyl-CoA synthetase (AMP-forming)/AMP-acid ligase II